MENLISYEVGKDTLLERLKSFTGLNHLKPISRRILGNSFYSGCGYYRYSSINLPEVGDRIDAGRHAGFRSYLINVTRVDEKGYSYTEEILGETIRMPLVFVKSIKTDS